jgi:dimethylaniline monooxygenase (N-oxide forming)
VTTQGADGHKETRPFDAVAVCCGTHQVPKRPAFEGAESFEGDIDHSYQFWNASKYAGKNVAVVGMGESSADVVRDISDVSASCHLVLRTYPMCVPRLLPDGHPADSMTSRLFYPNRTDSLLVWGLAAIIAFVLWAPLVLLGFVKEHLKWPYSTDAFGQTKETYMDVRTKRTKELVALMAKMHGEQNLSFCNKFATKNVSWIPNVVDGKIKMQLGKVQRLGPRSLTLEDGSTLNDLDAIVFCTGYKDEFAFLPQHIAPADNDVRRLYLHAFNPAVGSSMAFIGFSRPTTGAIPACSELVARYFALLVSEKRSLPKDVAARAVANWKAEDKLMYNSLSVRSCVNPCEYMDDVAEQIGCVPSPWMYWYNPLKFLDHLVALNCVARFRLVGPHAKPLMAKKWLDKIPITAPLPAVLILMVNKVLFCLGLSTGDIMIDLRKWNVEATWVLAIAQPRGF